MRAAKFIILQVLICATLFSCAWTSLNTIKNPEFSRTQFKRLLIVSPFQDIGLRKQSEDCFIYQFRRHGIDSASSLKIIPPIKGYDEKELSDILIENKIDGILVVALQDFWTSQSYVPKRSSTQGSASLYGNSLYYKSYTAQYGGYYISKPRVKFEIRLFDINSGEIAWLATSVTRGNAFANYKVLTNSLSKETVKSLMKERIVVR